VDIEAETHSDVILVPASALVREGEATSVFVAAGEKAQRREVTVGLSDGEHVEILSGVKAGEQVITSNQNGLPDDAAITVAQPGAPGVKDGAGQVEP
jgi:multidrug efflux pump subunit AcrA (membrane-fusion protein)